MKKLLITLVGCLVGLLVSIASTTSSQASSRGCAYYYCDVPSGQCLVNQNATFCASPNGQPPCTTSSPCFDPGGN